MVAESTLVEQNCTHHNRKILLLFVCVCHSCTFHCLIISWNESRLSTQTVDDNWDDPSRAFDTSQTNGIQDWWYWCVYKNRIQVEWSSACDCSWRHSFIHLLFDLNSMYIVLDLPMSVSLNQFASRLILYNIMKKIYSIIYK